MGPSRTARQAPLLLAIAGACALGAAGTQLRLPQLLAAAALLVAGAAVLALGRRRRLRSREAAARRPGELYGRKAVVSAGNRMLEADRGAARPLTVAVVELDDLPEVRSLFGSEVAAEIAKRVAVRLQAIATDGGLAERTSPTQFTVLLPGMEAATARNALHAVFGEGGCVEHECDGEELVLLPEVRVAQVADRDTSILETYAALCTGAAKTTSPATGEPPAGGAYVPTVPVPL